MKRLLSLVSFPRMMVFALLFLWSGCFMGKCRAQVRNTIDPYRFGIPCGSFTAENALWNTTQTVGKSGGLTGLADSKTVTVSFWIKKADSTSNTRNVLVGSNNGVNAIFQINIQTMLVTGNFDGPGGQVAFQSSALVGTNTWTHVLIAFDSSDTAKRHIYFNGTEDNSVTWSPYDNITLDLTPSVLVNIGANALGNNVMNGALAEFWMDDVYLNDPTKFICTSGGTHPISLGATGNLPTGSAPALYLSKNGSGNSWATDSSGNGNTMTVSGTLSSTTSP